MYRALYGNLSLWSITPNVSSFEFIHYKNRYYEEGDKVKFIYL